MREKFHFFAAENLELEYVTLDFETANADHNSACELGITVVVSGVIVDSKGWLIQPNCYPDFNIHHVRVHGITAKMVEDSPAFAEVWSEVEPYLTGRLIVAHNATFDLSVLQKSLEASDLDVPELEYFDSVELSKKAWPELPKYGLKTLCETFQIPLQHHRAQNDAYATAQVVIKALETLQVEEVEDLRKVVSTKILGRPNLPKAKKKPYKRKFSKGKSKSEKKGENSQEKSGT